MENQNELRKQLLDYLDGRHAHALLEDAIKNFPLSAINKKPKNVPYSFWALLEHIRITQYDIVDFIQNSNYKELEWPKDYWPPKNKKATKIDWQKTINNLKKDFDTLKKIAKNPKADLLAKIAHSQGQTILREIILVVDHNSYHRGEFVVMRRTMRVWKR